MIDGTLVPVLGLGFALGLRHALDPDHVVAVTAIVGEQRSFKRSSLIGAFWGLGHTAALLAAGIAIMLLKLPVTESMALWLESVVALTLVLLGLNAVLKPLRVWKRHTHRHALDGPPYIHSHIHRHRHLVGLGARPFLVGLVHGLAGSAALMIVVLATIPTAVAGLIYVAVFGLGSIGGMLLMSSVISVPFVLTARRFSRFSDGLQVMAGLFSLSFGLFLLWQYGFRD